MDTYTITVTTDGDEQVVTTIRVDVSEAEPRIAEFTVRSAAGASIVQNPLADVDLSLLVQALRPARRTGPSAPAAPRGRVRLAGRRRGPAGPRSGRTQPAPDGRVYRKVPDDLVATYEQIGSITAVAAHYGVPRHTAQGWINRMRQQNG